VAAADPLREHRITEQCGVHHDWDAHGRETLVERPKDPRPVRPGHSRGCVGRAQPGWLGALLLMPYLAVGQVEQLGDRIRGVGVIHRPTQGHEVDPLLRIPCQRHGRRIRADDHLDADAREILPDSGVSTLSATRRSSETSSAE
jgi:hypothetical protein